MARRRLGLAILALSENSFTPMARITLPSASRSGTPSAAAARRNSRAKTGFWRSRAKPSFQSLLRLAMCGHLQVIGPVPPGSLDILGLGTLVAAEEKNDERPPDLPEIDPIPRTERQASFPDSAAHRLVITQVPHLEPEHSRLNAGFDRQGEWIKPSPVGTFPLGGQVFPDDKLHRPSNTNHFRYF